jgi:hypothetical protein
MGKVLHGVCVPHKKIYGDDPKEYSTKSNYNLMWGVCGCVQCRLGFYLACLF